MPKEPCNFDFPYFLSEVRSLDNSMMEMILMDSNWPICDLRDEQGYTVLHHAVLVAIDGKVEHIIKVAKEKDGMTSRDIEKWVNLTTYDEKWTALHFCSFSGHLNSAYCLIENKADVFAINKNGLNMLHCAA